MRIGAEKQANIDISDIEPIETAIISKMATHQTFETTRAKKFELLLRNHFSDFIESDEYLEALKHLKFGGKKRGEMEQVILSTSGSKIFMVIILQCSL